MKLPLYFISDTHIGMQINESEIKRRNRLYKLFDNIKLTGGTLIIGGDFFDFWFEFGKKAPKIYSDVFEELESLKQHGIDIHYVAGNHDYWNFGYFESTFLKSFYKDDFSINKFGLKILVTHGDGLLKSDVGYRALKKVIRNKIFIFLFKIFGERIGYKIGSKASAYYPHYYQKKQSEKSKEQNSDEVKADILEFANNMWSDGYDVVLVGHYHKKEIIKEGQKLLIFLGDWMKHYSITKFDGKEWTQFSWNE